MLGKLLRKQKKSLPIEIRCSKKDNTNNDKFQHEILN
jgi:hypothetical protein